MAGDDSYHAHCFKCKVCKNRIDELVFAKTSNGIYCMKCHNERMIRIRKHTQKKAERERAQGGSGSSKSRERLAREHHRENTASLAQLFCLPSYSLSTRLLPGTTTPLMKLHDTTLRDPNPVQYQMPPAGPPQWSPQPGQWHNLALPCLTDLLITSP